MLKAIIRLTALVLLITLSACATTTAPISPLVEQGKELISQDEQLLNEETAMVEQEAQALELEKKSLENEIRLYQIALSRKQIRKERKRVRLMSRCHVRSNITACAELKKGFPVKSEKAIHRPLSILR